MSLVPCDGIADASAVIDASVCGTDTSDACHAANPDALVELIDHTYCTGCMGCVGESGRVTMPAIE